MSENKKYWDGPALFGEILKSDIVKPWMVLVLGVVAYWCVPMISTMCEGTFISESMGNKIQKYLPVFFDVSASFKCPKGALGDGGLTYVKDTSHHLFTICISLGAMFACLIVKNVNPALNKMVSDEIFSDQFSLFRSKVRWFNLLQKKSAFYMIPAFFSVLSLFFFVDLYKEFTTVNWWGNHHYGVAGLLFSFIIQWMVFFGVYYVLHIAISSLMLGRIMEIDISLRPFHEDGCNGLEPLGVIVVYFWGFAICLAGAVFVALRFGYLGIEDQVFTWLIALLGVLCIPMIAVYPLYKSIQAVYKYRRYKLARLDSKISSVLDDLDSGLTGASDDELVKQTEVFEKLSSVHKVMYSINMWPFDVKVLVGAILVYFAQAFFILKQVAEKVTDAVGG
ncbi:hypothetical protein [Maridesulfovibrio sp.]|uniref:hypothetical protein n=1 Tax=Maridesulfovibrio sp. TaxID=2795000 RepID=UPI003BAADB10